MLGNTHIALSALSLTALYAIPAGGVAALSAKVEALLSVATSVATSVAISTVSRLTFSRLIEQIGVKIVVGERIIFRKFRKCA